MTARRLATYFLLGALLLATRRLWRFARAESAPLLVPVAAGAEPADLDHAVDNAALVDLAIAARWPLHDRVVRELALAAMRADDPDGDAETLIARGLALGMTRIDPATRARLAWLGRELLRTEVRTGAPDPAVLAAYQTAHPERYQTGWLVLHQLTVSRARHGDGVDRDARALLGRLGGLAADAPGGDPSLLPAHLAGTRAAVDARFGPGFAAQLATAPLGQWSGPYAGSFGEHLVWLESRDAGPTSDLGARVLRDWHQDELEAAVRRALAARVKARRIQLEDGQ